MQDRSSGDTPFLVGHGSSVTETISTNQYKVTTPAPREAWRQVLASDPNALIFHTPEWADALCATGQYEDASRLYEMPGGRKLLLPMVQQKIISSDVTIRASMPDGWGLGGLVSTAPLQQGEIDLVVRDLVRTTGLQTVIRPNPLLAGTWETGITQVLPTSRRASHILDLEGGFSHVWEKKFKGTARTAIRKSERAGLEIEVDVSGKLIPTYYDIYLNWTERRSRERHIPTWLAHWTAKRREPLQKFALAAQAMKEACQVWVVKLNGEPIAASILLTYKENAFFWRNASIRELATSVRANDLLQGRMIEQACLAGCRYYHMGESGGVESLKQFKSRFGAVETPYSVYSLERLPVTHWKHQLRILTKSIERRITSSGE